MSSQQGDVSTSDQRRCPKGVRAAPRLRSSSANGRMASPSPRSRRPLPAGRDGLASDAPENPEHMNIGRDGGS